MMAREADPHRSRTIGILTKPDRVEPVDMGPWIKILEGGAEKLRLGWYVVKVSA